jgi:hypothetical protein
MCDFLMHIMSIIFNLQSNGINFRIEKRKRKTQFQLSILSLPGLKAKENIRSGSALSESWKPKSSSSSR